MAHISTTPHHRHFAYSWRSWVVVLTAALFFFFEFIQMNMFNAIAPSLIASYKVNAAALGNLSAMYFYGNVLFLIPAGILLDRFSTRRLLLTAITTCVICTYLFAFSSSLELAGFFRLITGMGSTFCMLSAVRLASRWFPPNKIALVIGLVVTMAMAGGMLAQTPLALMVHAVGWRHAVTINATLGVFFIVIIALCVRDYPSSIREAQIEERQQLKALGFWTSFAMALKNPQNWLAGLFTNFLSFPVIILGAAWGSLYLMHVHGLSHIQTTNITQMIFLGMIVGSPLMGFISDKLARRKLPMILGAILTLLIMLWIILDTHLSIPGLMVLFFLLGLLSGVQVITYPLIVESNPRKITTTAEGLTCMLVMSAGLFQPVFGWLIDLTWDGARNHGVPVYTAHNFQVAIWLLPAVFLVALCLAFFLKETRCASVD
ncbi:MAG: MFS transporter [Gammaproteobacteria bacterium CG11_big_fil_rev_8_21_14_0_20_46_22]|nr:MAG: MFS transporter [Gammaproteobacteria bacterium CG12_big_fil_rev_8_21_14_0_65_46_12]PIR11459.1 MAG: MFS transporter [Gammaproteobacteria bacterium CG11_big_fil_rev_8_21_14_0_20_46_22]